MSGLPQLVIVMLCFCGIAVLVISVMHIIQLILQRRIDEEKHKRLCRKSQSITASYKAKIKQYNAKKQATYY